jgi:hypothetical protein
MWRCDDCQELPLSSICKNFRLVAVSSNDLPIAFPQAEKSIALDIDATE